MKRKVSAALKKIEDDAKRRDQTIVNFCPGCGCRPEIPFINEGRHIYTGNCEKCQAGFVIHVCR